MAIESGIPQNLWGLADANGNPTQPAAPTPAASDAPAAQPAAPVVNPPPQVRYVQPRPLTAPQPVPQSQPQGQPIVPNTPIGQSTDQAALQQMFTGLQSKFDSNNVLMDQRNILLKALYDPLSMTPDDRNKLDPSFQQALDSGDRNQIDQSLRLISDEVAGRSGTLNQSIQYLTSDYTSTVTAAETQKQDAIQVIQNNIVQFGNQAFSNLPEAQKRQLEQTAGFPTGYLDNIPQSISQQRYGTVPTGTGTVGSVSIPTGTIASQNNNPFNLRLAGQPGATQGAGGFAAFSDSQSGYAAGVADVTAKMSGQSPNPIPDGPDAGQVLTPNSTLEDMIRVYAPTADGNDPVSYAAQVAQQLGTSPQSTLGSLDPNQVAAAMAQHESGTTVSQSSAPANPTVQAWIDAVTNGNSTMAQVPAQYKSDVVLGLDSNGVQSYSPLASSRFTTAATKIVSNYISLPQYQLTANGLPYVQRIQVALNNPGSVSDQDLLDSFTKLSTSGNAISDEQVRIITGGQSIADVASVYANKISNGGVLSDSQRQQIGSIADAEFAAYQKSYQPIYDQATSQLKSAGIPKAFWTIPDLNALSSSVDGNAAAPSTDSTVSAGSTVTYNGQTYTVDAQGNMSLVGQ